jgi:hypothetical protein
MVACHVQTAVNAKCSCTKSIEIGWACHLNSDKYDTVKIGVVVDRSGRIGVLKVRVVKGDGFEKRQPEVGIFSNVRILVLKSADCICGSVKSVKSR